MLEFLVLAVAGFTACAEFGSYAFVHPVVRALPPAHHIRVEQGLLRTFGRVMPILMPLSAVLVVTWAVRAGGAARWAAAAAFLVAVLITVTVNVPVNAATGRWDPEAPPADWAVLRRRWERAQGVRSGALLAGFLLLCLAAV